MKLNTALTIVVLFLFSNVLYSSSSNSFIEVLHSDESGLLVQIDLSRTDQTESEKDGIEVNSFIFGIPYDKKPLIESSGFGYAISDNSETTSNTKPEIDIEELGFFRFLKLARLTIKLPKIKETEVNIKQKNIQVKVKFVPKNEKIEARELILLDDDKGFTEIYKRIVINFDQAKDWLTRKKITEIDDYIIPEFILYIEETGIYHVTYEYLENAGVPIDKIIPSTIQLFNKNTEVPIYFFGGDDGRFDAGDYFDFYGKRNTEEGYFYSNWTDENPYFLKWNVEDGMRIREVSSIKEKGEYFSEFLFFEHYEFNSLYDGEFYGTDGDSWMWERIDSDYTFEYEPKIENPAQTTQNAYLKISCHSLTTNDHHVTLYMNEYKLGDIFWNGDGHFNFPAGSEDPPLVFPNNILDNSENRFMLQSPGDVSATGYESFYLNWFEIYYYRTFDMQNKGKFVLRGNSEETVIQQFKLENPRESSYDIYNITTYEKILGCNRSSGKIEFSTPASLNDWFYIVDDKSKKLPSRIVSYRSSDLRSTQNGADYLIITTQKFKDVVKPLARWHEAKGLRVKIACVEDIYVEFGNGLYNAESIQKFTRYAFENWDSPSFSYVLIVGDATWDRFKRRKEPESFKDDFVPCYLDPVRDDFYVYLTDDDLIPDASIGRIPSQDESQVTRIVNKILYYEGFPQKGDWWKRAIFVNGGKLERYFELNTEFIKDRFFPDDWEFIDIFKNITPETKPYDQMILGAFDNGASFLTFQGHGATEIWDSEPILFDSAGAKKIDNAMKLPVVLNLSCHTGRFGEPNTNSISEYLTTHSNDFSGAICFWGSSGVSIIDISTLLSKKFFQNIFLEKIDIVGDAILLSKISMFELSPQDEDYVISTYVSTQIFIGDPAMRISIPPNPEVPENVQAKLDENQILYISWDSNKDPRIKGYRIYYSKDSNKYFEGTEGISWLVSGDFIGKVNNFEADDVLNGDYFLYIRSETENGLLSQPSQVVHFKVDKIVSGSEIPIIYGGNASYNGNILNLTVNAKDEDDEQLDVVLYYMGINTGLKLNDDGLNGDDKSGDDLYTYEIPVNSLVSGNYFLEFLAEDQSGNRSYLYPYLNVGAWNDNYYNFYTEAYPYFQDYEVETYCNESSPVILYAGYEETFISTHFGGVLKISVLVSDPDGTLDIDKVKFYYNGIYTGLDFTEREDKGMNAEFNFDLQLSPGIGNKRYLFQFVAVDKMGNTSSPWPYLRIM